MSVRSRTIEKEELNFPKPEIAVAIRSLAIASCRRFSE